MKKDFLLEIGCENLPSGYLDDAVAQLERSFRETLKSQRLPFESIGVSGTPNRLVVLVRQLAPMQETKVETVTGPPVSVAVDKDGNYTRAALGFAEREGIEPGSLKKISTGKGEYLAVERKISGRAAGTILAENVPALISGVRFPKAMKWDGSGFRFARPVRWVLALFGDAVIKIKVGNVVSSDSTGLSPFSRERVGVDGIADYFSVLKKHGILLDNAERKKQVSAMAARAAAETGGHLVEDDGLCSMVSNLLESPVVMSGKFDRSFLELPREVIVTALKSHQRYFSVEGAGGGLKPAFIAFADGATRNKKEIVKGYERVLQARLADARFYFNEDTSVPLGKMAEKLEGIVWLEGLGTLRQKAERLGGLCGWLLERIETVEPGIEETTARAARLAKADLASEMVKDGKEFTLLQGYIGREYARASGEPDPVCEAIYEHYFPRFSGDRLPEGEAGTLVSIADKLDTIAGCHIQGLGPTGSQDPYALRRQAISILRIMIERRLAVSLREAAARGIDIFREEGLLPGDEDGRRVLAEVLDLFAQRFNTMLRGEGYDHDLVTSVLSSPWEVPYAVRDAVRGLQEMRGNGSLADFILAMKRVINIIPKERRERISGASGRTALEGLAERDESRLGVKRSLFSEKEEQLFFDAACDAASRLARLELPAETARFLEILPGIIPAVNAYFDKVMVNCDDAAVRENRLSFLTDLYKAFGLFCDYSQIAGEQA